MKNRIKEIIVGVVLVGLTILLMQKCNNTEYSKLKGEYKQLKKQYEKQKDGVETTKKNRIIFEDSINQVLKSRDKKVESLKKEISLLENKKYKPITVPKDVKGLVEYFNDRYNTKENTFIQNKVALTEFVAYDVSFELEEGDNLRELTLDQKTIIDKQKEVIQETEAKVKEKDLVIDFRGKELKEREELQKTADENIKNLEAQTKKLKRKNTLNKILLPIAVLGGGFIGYKIAK